MTNLSKIFHVVVLVYRLVKIWSLPQFPVEFRNGLLFISFNLDFWKIMKLLFLLLLCVVILARSSRSPSFDVRLHGSSSIPIASFVEHGLFIKICCHRKYLNRRIVYSSGHQGTFNPAVITNTEEVHMVHGNINTNDETSHTTSNAKKRSFKISDYFSKKKGKPSLSGKLCIIFATFFWMCSMIELFRHFFMWHSF